MLEEIPKRVTPGKRFSVFTMRADKFLSFRRMFRLVVSNQVTSEVNTEFIIEGGY